MLARWGVIMVPWYWTSPSNRHRLSPAFVNKSLILSLSNSLSFSILLLRSFPTNKHCFTINSPHITAQGAIGLDHAVTGDQKSNGVTANGRPYSSGSFGATDLPRNAAIGGQCTHGNFKQRFPHLKLKGGAFQVQLNLFHIVPASFENCRGSLLKSIIILYTLSGWKFIDQLLHS